MTVRSWVSLCALCALCGESSAASPHVAAVQPRGAKQGTDLTLTFTGTNLGDAREVIAYGPGVAVEKPVVVSPTQVTAKATVAADCRLGEHAFRLRTATGVSDLRTFWVGALPTADEAEPNNEFDKPQLVTLNTTVHGSIGGEDQDFFAVECKKGQRLAVEVEGMRLGGGLFDPYVAILDSKRFELATSDDHPRLGQDGACAIQVPADGRYVVQVRESAYGAGSQYRLHVGTFPAPAAVIPAGGRPGEEVEVRFVGDPLGEIKQKVKLPAEADPNFRLFCRTADGVCPSGFKFRVVDLPNTNGTEANVSHPAAVAGPAPGAFNGVVDKPRASKVFKFAAKKGEAFDVQCYARRVGSPLDPVMHVGPADGSKSLASNDDSGGPDSQLAFTAPADGEYSVWVHDHLNKAGPTYVFRVEVRPARPGVTLTVPKADTNNPQNQDRQAITVPKGNRFAALVNVTRKDVGGPLAVGFGPLPPGVTAAADPADPGQSAVPVVFEASKDAEVGAVFGAFTAADPKGAAAPARTASDTALSVGNNQTVYHRHEADRVAAAVTEAAPFKIEVAEPKAPVVQNGSLNLKVTATRAEGFKGPITVVPLWVPPGMGIQGSATIPEGSTEVVLTMNAAGNAGAKKWKTALLASGDAGAGPVWVSSQLFAVEVAPPPVGLAMTRAAVEQGKPADVACQVTVNAPFDGEATVKLLGLPAKATAPDRKLTKDSKEVTFAVATEPGTPVGKHKVFCQVVLTVNGEEVALSTGGAELRVDAPLPATPAAPAAKADPATPAAPAKRVSRLEQLRAEQEAKEKGGKK
jgi:hypothetical protein